MDILKRVKQAQKRLRSTQKNWQEACLFDCDEMFSDIISELEAAQHGVQADVCPACNGLKIVRNDDGLGSKVCPACNGAGKRR